MDYATAWTPSYYEKNSTCVQEASRTHSAARVRGVRAASIDDRAEAEVLLQLLEDMCSIGLYEYALASHLQGRHNGAADVYDQFLVGDERH